MKKVEIYTDGACSNNPGLGGYCAILLYGEHKKVVKGGDKLTTNNRMEMLAIIEGLKALKHACEVKLYSDSAYCVNAFKNKWLDSWKKNNWKTSSKSDVKNKDLWEELYNLTQKHKVEFIKVKGHADNYYNNQCDEIARGVVDEFKKQSS